MIRIVKGAVLFAAGFAAAAALFLGNSEVPQAEAGDCIMQSAQAKLHDQNMSHNRFGVKYTPPQCIQDAGFKAVNARIVDGQTFIVVYQK